MFQGFKKREKIKFTQKIELLQIPTYQLLEASITIVYLIKIIEINFKLIIYLNLNLNVLPKT